MIGMRKPSEKYSMNRIKSHKCFLRIMRYGSSFELRKDSSSTYMDKMLIQRATDLISENTGLFLFRYK